MYGADGRAVISSYSWFSSTMTTIRDTAAPFGACGVLDVWDAVLQLVSAAVNRAAVRNEVTRRRPFAVTPRSILHPWYMMVGGATTR